MLENAGVLLVNLGTPDSPTTADVRRYLKEFLLDSRVIDIPTFQRNLLVRGIILPFRPKASAEAYRKIWTKRGSPLLYHTQDLAAKLSLSIGDGVPIEIGMRYGNPSIRSGLLRLLERDINRIVVFPLFPQYSSASWGSAVARVYRVASTLGNVPAVQVVPPYYDHAAYISACATIAEATLDDFAADRVMMSFHGLPERQLRKSDDTRDGYCLTQSDCCGRIVPENRNCYRAQSFATARALAERLGLSEDRYEVTFQSRLGRTPWIRPYTDERARALAESGVKRLAVLSPSFAVDCLETIEEIGIRAAEDFVKHGGEELRLVPSLNSEDVWVSAVARILQDPHNSLLAQG
ncbi:MAG: ferrochelatase [Phycisphaerales bacterium]|nr:MAG: ferrochelatase [Phycisphaerales bacterium]